MMTIWGIDFSAAQHPAAAIWIAAGSLQNHQFLIHSLSPLSKFLPHSRLPLEICLEELVRLIQQHRPMCVALDFPFGLPQEVNPVDIVPAFWEGFFQCFPSPDALFTRCNQYRPLPLRFTDRVQRVPYSPCNLRLYRQTYWGIGAVLKPLGVDPGVSILPFQIYNAHHVNVLEICPASILKRNGRYIPYKGSTPQHALARAEIVAWISRAFSVVLPAEVRESAIAQTGGDAVDALLACLPPVQLLRRYGCIPAPGIPRGMKYFDTSVAQLQGEPQ